VLDASNTKLHRYRLPFFDSIHPADPGRTCFFAAQVCALRSLYFPIPRNGSTIEMAIRMMMIHSSRSARTPA